MRAFSRWLYVLCCLLPLVSCAATPTPPPTPRIPEVLATIPIRHGNDSVIVNPRTGYVYVSNDSDFGYVTILKGAELVKALSTKGSSSFDLGQKMAVDEVNGWVYVLNRSSNTVAVIRDTEVITTLNTFGRLPVAIVVEPRSHWAYIVSEYGKDPQTGKDILEGTVTVIKGQQVIGNIKLGHVLLTRVIADPVNGYVYTGGTNGNFFVLKGLEKIAEIEQANIVGTDGAINAMSVNSQTGEVFVLDGNGRLHRLKVGKALDSIGLKGSGNAPAPRNTRVHPHTGDVYVVDWGAGAVIVLRDMKEVTRLPVGKSPLKMEIDPLTGNVYVANYDDSTVSVIQGTEVIATIKVGLYPYGIAINPTNGWVYTSNHIDGTVSVLGYPPPNYTPPAPTKTPTAPTRAPTPKPYP
jgi:YVTN family beta-propeller protein